MQEICGFVVTVGLRMAHFPTEDDRMENLRFPDYNAMEDQQILFPSDVSG